MVAEIGTDTPNGKAHSGGVYGVSMKWKMEKYNLKIFIHVH
jgi:hypothetical protein